MCPRVKRVLTDISFSTGDSDPAGIDMENSFLYLTFDINLVSLLRTAMKILFAYPYCLNPRIKDDDVRVPPIGLYYLAAACMDAGHTASIVNWHDAGNKPHIIQREITEYRPDLLAISVLHANRWGAIEIATQAKRLIPGIQVVLGGPGATFLYEPILKGFHSVDFIVLGEGEETFLELLNRLQQQSGMESVPGIAFRTGSKIIRTEERPFIQELDSLPDPARFFRFQHLISSRGCPWNCTFCGSPAIWKRKVRFHSPDWFVNQIERLVAQGINFFFISDDTFTLKKERVIHICQEIIRRRLDISWQAISRVNHVDQEILLWMRRAGCTQISYGIESGSPNIRKKLNKDIPEKRIITAFKETTRTGILPRAYFIYGSPGETERTIAETKRLMDIINPLAAVFYIMSIFPGTAMYREFKAKTGIKDQIWFSNLSQEEEILYFETDPSISREMILKWGKELRRHFFSRLPVYIREIELIDLPELYPLHADFLSRLAMTFAFGDYSKSNIPDRDEIAMSLFRRALDYAPDHRAYLGMAVMLQKRGDHEKAVQIARQGVEKFSHSNDLTNCIAVSLMNTGRFQEAATLLKPFTKSPVSLQYLLQCARELGDNRLYQETLNRLRAAGGPEQAGQKR